MKYFVKSKSSTPEKGPFELAALLESFDKHRLTRESLVRATDSIEWRPLAGLVPGVRVDDPTLPTGADLIRVQAE